MSPGAVASPHPRRRSSQSEIGRSPLQLACRFGANSCHPLFLFDRLVGVSGSLRPRDYLRKSLDRNTTGRSAWACSSKNLRDARSSMTSRSRKN